MEPKLDPAQQHHTWPLVPFLVIDNKVVDDIPNTADEMADGWSRPNSYYIGASLVASNDWA